MIELMILLLIVGFSYVAIGFLSKYVLHRRKNYLMSRPMTISTYVKLGKPKMKFNLRRYHREIKRRNDVEDTYLF